MSWLIDRPSPVPSPAGFVVKNGLNIFALTSSEDAGAVVPDPDLDRITEVAGRRGERRRAAHLGARGLAPGRGVEAVRDEVQEHARDLLRVHLGLPGLRVEMLLERDVEAGFLGPSAVVGEVQALLDERVDAGKAPLAGALARVEEHVLDD